MSGSATLTTVMSKSNMKIAPDTAINVHHLRSTATPCSHSRTTKPRSEEDVSAWKSLAGAGHHADISRTLARAQLSCQEGHDLGPQLRGGPGPVGRAVVGDEGVPGALIHIHFDHLPAGGGALAQLLADLGRGILVL